jgi:oxalate decarboxylase/phosphoglucose isomerase-like protein (cupin superfamily)
MEEPMTASPANPIDPAARPTQTFDWGAITWLVAPGVTEGAAISFGEVVLMPGQGHDRHNHPQSEEILYVLSGEGVQMVNDEDPFPVRAGDTIYVPTAVFHSTVNTGWAPLRLLAIYNPGGPERDLETLPGYREVPAGALPAWTRAEEG